MKSNIELRFIELLRKPIKSVEEIAEMNRVRELFGIELHEEIKDLSEELKTVGSKYIYPWDMVNTKESYPEAVDILLKYLPKKMHDKNKEGIIRALSVKEAAGKATPILLKEFYNTPKEKENLRWVIGNAIFSTITKNDVDSILEVVLDKENGISRQRFIAALGRIKSEKIEDALINLLDEEEVAIFALEALGRLKSKKSMDKIASLINHPNTLIKKEVSKVLKKLE